MEYKNYISRFNIIQLLVAIVGLVFLGSCKNTQKTTTNAAAGQSSVSGLSDREQMEYTYLFHNASKEKILGNNELALNLYLKCVKMNPNDPAANYEVANILDMQGGNLDQCLAYIKKAAELNPDNVWYQIFYAETLQKKRRFNDAINVYQNIVKKNPDRIDYQLELAGAYIYANKLEEATKVYDKVESQIGVQEETSLQKIRLYKVTKSYDKAIVEINKLIEQSPKDTRFYGMLGEIYSDKGDEAKALETYNKIIELDPNNGYVHLSLADYYRSKKQNDKFNEEVKLAFKSTDLDIDTKVRILLSYYSAAEVSPELKKEAFDLCAILVEVHKDDPKSFSIYGDFLYRDKKNEEARTQFRKALSLDKSRYPIWNQVLIIDSELSDFESMYKEGKEAIELFPNQPVAYLLTGLAALQMKKTDEAIETMLAGKTYVVDNKPLLEQYYSNLGDAYNQKKDYTQSDSYYEKALEINPKNAYVLNNYSYYLSLRKDRLEEAERMSKRSNEIESSASFMDTYGWILYQMKKYTEAREWIEKSINAGSSESPTVIEHYGDVLFQLGEKEKALENWKKAKEKLKDAKDVSEFLDKKIADQKLYE